MARQVGPFFIVGQLGNLLFYELNGGYFVKMINQGSGGMKQGERSRENAAEFKQLVKAGKQLRETLGLHWKLIKDPKKSGRLTKYFGMVKKEDPVSLRGSRNFFEGLGTRQGRDLLLGLDLNQFAELRSTFPRSTELHITTSEIQLKDVIASRDIRFPHDLNAVRFTALRLDVSIDEGKFLMVTSEVQVLHRDSNPTDLLLHIPPIKSGCTVQLVLLSMCFVYQKEDIPGVWDARREHVLNVAGVFPGE